MLSELVSYLVVISIYTSFNISKDFEMPSLFRSLTRRSMSCNFDTDSIASYYHSVYFTFYAPTVASNQDMDNFEEIDLYANSSNSHSMQNTIKIYFYIIF